MERRFQFSTRRMLLVTTVLAVWVAVFVGGNHGHHRPRSVNSVPLQIDWAKVVYVVVLPTLLLAALAAGIVMVLGGRAQLAAQAYRPIGEPTAG